MFARMDGLMMDRPLLIRDIAERVERLFPDREIVSRTHTGVERSSYGEGVARAGRGPGVAGGLRGGGAGEAARVVGRAPRGEAGRPGRDVRLELAPAPRAVPRGAVDGRDP